MTEAPLETKSSARTAIKVAVALIVIGGFAALWFSPLRTYLTREHIRVMAESVRGVWYAPLLLIVAYAVGCIFAIPASALIGGVIGGTSSFLLGRFLGEGVLARFGRLGRVVEKQVDHAGFKSLLILRLIPLFPFAVLNYGAGVAGVKLLDFVFATALGVAPSNFVFAYSADAIFNGTMTEGDALKRLLIIAALLIAVIVIPAMLKKRMRPAQPDV